MEEVLGLLCGLSFVLLIVTVIGHGLWLLCAAIIRALSGESSPASQTPSRPCPTCGRLGTVVEGRCRVCGAVPAVSAPTTLTQELEATARHLERLLRRGIVKPDEFERMMDSIRADLTRLRQPENPHIAQPAAAATPQSTPSRDVVVDAEVVGPPPVLRLAESAQAKPQVVRQPLAPVAESPLAAANPLAPVRIPGVVHPLDKPEPVSPPAPPLPSLPRRTLREITWNFMEASNIRLFEVISGLLIVGCSIGLVVSLRNTLKAIPYAPALLFMLFTVAFHGAGMYTLRRWKLEAISRTILIISLLLVPLGFSAGIVLSGSGETLRPAGDPLFLTALVIGTLTFGWVTISASREAVCRDWRWLAIGVLGSSLSQVLISRLAQPGMSTIAAMLLAGVPLGCFLLATGGQLVAVRMRPRMNRNRIVELLLVLGIATFALLVPLSLMVHLSGQRLGTLANLSPTISLAAAAILAAGLAVHVRTRARSLAAYRVAGTSVAVLGGLAMLAAVALAWPRPELLLAVGVANGAVLFALAIVSRIAPLYAAALAACALAAIVAAHLLGGTLPMDNVTSHILLQALLTCRSSIVLTIVSAIAGAAGWQFLKWNRSDEGAIFVVSAGAGCVSSALLAAFVGYVPAELWTITPASDVLWAAPLLCVHGLALIGLAPRFRQPAMAIAGSAVLWLGLVHGVTWNDTVQHALSMVNLLPQRPVLCATLVHAVLSGLVALAAAGRGLLLPATEFAGLCKSPRWQHLIAPLSLTTFAALAGALPFVLWAPATQLYWHATYAAWGAIVCLSLLLIWRHAAAFGSLQAFVALAAAFLTAAVSRDWLDLPTWRFDWRHLDAQVIVIALLATVWSGLRRFSAGWPVIRQLVENYELTVDLGLLAFSAVAVPLLAMLGVWPGILAELDAMFEIADWPLANWTESAGGIWDWLAVTAVVLALVTLLFVEGRIRDALAGLVAVLFALPWLMAGWFAEPVGVASAARWGMAVYVALFCTVAMVAIRWPSLRSNLVGRVATLVSRPVFAIWPFALGTAAILAITIAVVVQSVAGNRLGGPAADSWFDLLGPTLSFGIPLSVLVLASLAFSLAWRRAEMSILASLLFQLTVNLAFLIHLSSSSVASIPVRWVEWLQWNALALGVFGVVWSAVEWWKKRLDANAPHVHADLPAERWGNLTQLFLCGLGVRALAAWAAGAVAWTPGQTLFVTAQLGGWESFAALGFATAFLLWRSQRRLHYLALGVVAIAVMLVAFFSATADGYDPARQWLAYHVLTAGLLVVSTMTLLWHAIGRREIMAACAEQRSLKWPIPAHWAAAAAAALLVFLAIRGTSSDPAAPWWSAGAALGGVVVASGLALACRSQWYAYAGTLLAGLPVAIVLIDAPGWAVPWRAVFGEACLLASLTLAAIWLWLEVRSQKRTEQSFDAAFPLPAVHRFAAGAGLGVTMLLMAARLLLGAAGVMDNWTRLAQIRTDGALGVTLVFLLGLIAASLCDRRAIGTIPFLYCGGMLVVGYVLHLLRWPLYMQLQNERVPPFSYMQLLGAATPLAVASYVALTGELWHRGAHLSLLGQRLGVSDPVAGLQRTVRWLPGVSLLLAAGICCGSFFGVLSLESLTLRVLAGFAPALAAWGVARQAQQERQTPLQLTSLALAGLAAVLLGWAEIPPLYTDAAWMTRMFRLLMALSALTFLYGLSLPRFLLVEGAWNASLRRSGYGAAVLAIMAFVAVLALEFIWYVPGQGAPVADAQVGAVAVVLVALIAGLISLALFPARDPLVLSELGRTGYVYAAEAVLSLLFVHLYLCKPLWFDGVLRPYWPYVMMAIAYAGVGAGEICTRLRLRVLAEPLRNTGALLPLLPAIAMWVVAPQQSDYALVLLLAGVMYLAMSVAQRSWLLAAAAGVAGNGALWTILHRHDFDFTQNPQFWLIPPAVSVLIGAHVNRHRLDLRLLTAIRYAGIVIIYLSSTSEVWIRNIDKTVWPQMALLGLSLLGVLAGVMFRVRAFLYLGTSFTLVALCAMVWHAHRAIGETWPLWIFGIGVGLTIALLLALREKKREQIEALLAALQKWEK